MNQHNEGSQNGLSVSTSILIAGLLVAGSIICVVGKGGTNDPPSDAQDGKVAKLLEIGDRDVVLGERNAKVTIIEYGDYQCPFCARFFRETEPKIRSAYIETGKAKMIYRDLAFLSQESVAAAAAAECSKDQGKFWAYHDALYRTESLDGKEHNGNLNRELFLELATEVGLNVPEFTACIDSRKYVSLVEENTKRAQGAGITGTPTSFVNGREVSGAQPFEYLGTDPRVTPFKPLIESFLR